MAPGSRTSSHATGSASAMIPENSEILGKIVRENTASTNGPGNAETSDKMKVRSAKAMKPSPSRLPLNLPEL